MKCPYCAEEIQDDANVCRFCGRDLALVLSLKRENERLREKISALSALEDESHALTVSSDSPRTESGTSGTSPPPRSSRDRGTLSLRQRAWAVILPAVAVVASYIVDQELFFERTTEKEVAAGTTDILGLTQWHVAWTDALILSCLVSGCWVGSRLAGRQLKTYLFLGTLTALIAAVGVISYETIDTAGIGSHVGEMGLSLSGPPVLLSYFVFESHYVPVVQYLPLDYALSPLNVYNYTIIITALFISGALFGDLIERIHRPNEAKEGLPERIGARLLPNSASRKHLANTLRALPATLLLLTPLWEPIWSRLVEAGCSAIWHISSICS